MYIYYNARVKKIAIQRIGEKIFESRHHNEYIFSLQTTKSDKKNKNLFSEFPAASSFFQSKGSADPGSVFDQLNQGDQPDEQPESKSDQVFISKYNPVLRFTYPNDEKMFVAKVKSRRRMFSKRYFRFEKFQKCLTSNV